MNKNNLIGIALLVLLFNLFFVRNVKNSNNSNENVNKIEVSKNNNNIENNNINNIPNNTGYSTGSLEYLRSEKNKNINNNENDENSNNNTYCKLENDYVKYIFSTLGASIVDVELKNYKNHNGENVKLVDKYNLLMNLNFKNLSLNTSLLNFNELVYDNKSIEFKFVDSNGNEITIIYELDKDNPYVLNQKINCKDCNFIQFTFDTLLIQNEKYIKDCRNKSSLNYYTEDKKIHNIANINDLKTNKTSENIQHCEWINYKQKFFSIGFTSNCKMNGDVYAKYNDKYVNEYNSTVDFINNDNKNIEIKYYFGPNDLNYLKSFHKTFDQNIYLGIIGVNSFNRYILLPLSNTIGVKIGAILFLILLVIIINLIILPVKYKSYEGTKKMQKLAKLINHLSNKFKNNPQQLAFEQIKAYRDLHFNPFSIFLYSLIQFPFVIAIYNMIPIDLLYRNVSFLWCNDLSSFDSILDLNYYIPLYGDHVSFSALLMGITTFLYMISNSSIEENSNKISPVYIFFVIFIICISNRFCCALNIYYIIFNIITFLTNYIFNKKVNVKDFEDKINEKIRRIK